jgi:dTDP-4-amino-4,6-dideoxygalactose transaminase
MIMPIPFSYSRPATNELKYIAESLHSGNTCGGGAFTKKAEQELSALLNNAACMLTTSCTSALELSALLLDLQPGDEIIMPSFTFVSTANAFYIHGAKPVFADINPYTLNIDIDSAARLINEHTRAIIPIHYAGIAANMDGLQELCAQHNIMLIEDNAHGFGGTWKNKPLGTLGSLSALSFHCTKNISCGEGGALIINDRSYLERAEILRDKGTNRSRFFRGETDRYTWVDKGSSFPLSDILCAALAAQLEEMQSIQNHRHMIWNLYHQGLAEWCSEYSIQQPVPWQHSTHSAHIYYLILPEINMQLPVINYLKSKGIQATFHYTPLHSSQMAAQLGYDASGCPNTSSIAQRIIRLPLHMNISKADIEYIIDCLCILDPYSICESIGSPVS